MIRWTPIVFVRLLLFLAAGILVHIYAGKSFGNAVYWFVAAVLLFILLFAAKGRSTGAWWKTAIGSIGLTATFLFGIALTQLRTAKFHPHHLLNSEVEYTHYRAKINAYLQIKPQTYKTELLLTHVFSQGQWHRVDANIQASFPRNRITSTLRYGHVLVIKGQPALLKGPENPGEFDYRQYLHFQNIYHRHSIREQGFAIGGYQPESDVLAMAYRLRAHFDNIFRKYLPGQQQYALAKALVLGIKDELDNDIRRAYAGAGAMHVLAVSGLHVGIIYLVLEWFMGRFMRNRNSQFVKAAVSLLFIWTYALVTGFSASVIRAVVMFSFISLGKLMRRRVATYNMVAVSAFFMLCYNPFFLIEVGFQLSYLAVLGIVYLQPRLKQLLAFETRAANWVWEITTVSIAAQLITFPLGLLYFHQFPVYFMASNLVVIPAATVVLYGGMFLLWTSLWSPLAYVWGIALNGFIAGLNKLIFMFEDLPYSQLRGIDISVTETWLIYLILGFAIAFIALRKLRYIVLAAGAVLVLSASQLNEVFRNQRDGRFTVYAIRNQTAVEFLGANTGLFAADSALLNDRHTMQFFVWRNWWSMDAPEPELLDLNTTGPAKSLVVLPDGNRLLTKFGKSVLIVSKPLRISFPEEVKFDYVVLQNQPKINLNELNRQIKFRQLIIDSSNRMHFANQIEKEANLLGITLHSVPKQGAFLETFALAKPG